MPHPTYGVFPGDATPPREVRALAEAVAMDGGSVLACYQEPVGGAWQLFAVLPLSQVQPTPYQRDLSPAHAKRLREVIKRLERFVDPVVVVRHGPKVYWTPNGNHRRDALQKLKAAWIPAILIPAPEVAYQILALNTEKAHNLTLGLLYERHPRFSGSAYAPILRRVDGFLPRPLPGAYQERQGRAEQVEACDRLLTAAVARLKKRGVVHPYVKQFVMARVNPLTRARKTLPSFAATWEKVRAGLEQFDPEKIRSEDIARAAAFSPAE